MRLDLELGQMSQQAQPADQQKEHEYLRLISDEDEEQHHCYYQLPNIDMLG